MRHNKFSTSLSPSNFDSKGSVSSRSKKTNRQKNILKLPKDDLHKDILSKSEHERLKSEVSLLISISYLVVVIILGLLGIMICGEFNF